MKIRIIVTVLFFFALTARLQSQGFGDETHWNILLDDIKMRYAYSLKYDAFFPSPKFGKEIKALEGTEITIAGFFLPVEVTGGVYVVSYNPMDMCFFCTGAGVETVIEVYPKAGQLRHFDRLRTDDFIEVKGILRINTSQEKYLIYMMEEAEFIRKIR
jgi:hypothetical protein